VNTVLTISNGATAHTSHTAKIVLQAGDVVFAHVAAHLYLDDLYWLGAQVGYAVDLADGDVAVLAGVQVELAQAAAVGIAQRDMGHTAHYQPVLGAAGVGLQAQALACAHLEALDFVVAGGGCSVRCLIGNRCVGRVGCVVVAGLVDRLIPAPRALGVLYRFSNKSGAHRCELGNSIFKSLLSLLHRLAVL
jgi:hypothetical protein